MEIISVLTSAHCFCSASLERCKPKEEKKESDQQKPLIFPGSGRQEHAEFFLLFSGRSVVCVRQDELRLPFVPADRPVFAMATWEAALGLCRASLGHFVPLAGHGRLGELWALLGLTRPCGPCPHWLQAVEQCSLAFHTMQGWFGLAGP